MSVLKDTEVFVDCPGRSHSAFCNINIDMLLTSVSISTASGAMCQKKIRTIMF